MTKAKSKSLDSGIIFWVIVGLVFTFAGVGQVKVNYVNRVDNDMSWIIPIGLIVFGGMIIGVAVNKFSISMKAKHGKSSK